MPTVSGITTRARETDFAGEALGETHDVIKIRVHGKDASAIYSFDFSVAPMRYYSGAYNGVDYVKTPTAYVGVADKLWEVDYN